MAFAEDLDLFFDLGDFAVEAEIRQPDNTLVRRANVILSTPTQIAAIFDEAVAASSPFIQGRAADLNDARDNWKVVIGAASYRVSGSPFEDGTGVTIVYLKP